MDQMVARDRTLHRHVAEARRAVPFKRGRSRHDTESRELEILATALRPWWLEASAAVSAAISALHAPENIRTAFEEANRRSCIDFTMPDQVHMLVLRLEDEPCLPKLSDGTSRRSSARMTTNEWCGSIEGHQLTILCAGVSNLADKYELPVPHDGHYGEYSLSVANLHVACACLVRRVGGARGLHSARRSH